MNYALAQQYEKSGFVIVRNLLNEKTVEAIRYDINLVLDDTPEGLVVHTEPESEDNTDSQHIPRKIRNISQFSNYIRQIALSEKLAKLAKSLLGEPVGFYGDQVLFKSARKGSAKPLHQDSAYFRLSPPDAAVTFWCALDKADTDNGCLFYIPGSHKNGLFDHKATPNSPHLIAPEINIDKLEAVPAEPGDCIAHNSLTLHMTPPNKSNRQRWAILFHYVRTDATFPPRSTNAPSIVNL